MSKAKTVKPDYIPSHADLLDHLETSKNFVDGIKAMLAVADEVIMKPDQLFALFDKVSDDIGHACNMAGDIKANR